MDIYYLKKDVLICWIYTNRINKMRKQWWDFYTLMYNPTSRIIVFSTNHIQLSLMAMWGVWNRFPITGFQKFHTFTLGSMIIFRFDVISTALFIFSLLPWCSLWKTSDNFHLIMWCFVHACFAKSNLTNSCLLDCDLHWSFIFRYIQFSILALTL